MWVLPTYVDMVIYGVTGATFVNGRALGDDILHTMRRLSGRLPEGNESVCVHALVREGSNISANCLTASWDENPYRLQMPPMFKRPKGRDCDHQLLETKIDEIDLFLQVLLVNNERPDEWYASGKGSVAAVVSTIEMSAKKMLDIDRRRRQIEEI